MTAGYFTICWILGTKSEDEFKRKLNLSWRIRATNRPERRVGEVCIRRPEVCPVQDVEELGPKLHFSHVVFSGLRTCEQIFKVGTHFDAQSAWSFFSGGVHQTENENREHDEAHANIQAVVLEIEADGSQS